MKYLARPDFEFEIRPEFNFELWILGRIPEIRKAIHPFHSYTRPDLGSTSLLGLHRISGLF